jgi:hypothetical protein
LSSIAILAGNDQVTTTGTAFATPLRVRALDVTGAPIANIQLGFTVVASTSANATFSGSTFQVFVTTDSSGMAQAPTLTANLVAGSFEVRVFTTDTGTLATFVLTSVVP